MGYEGCYSFSSHPLPKIESCEGGGTIGSPYMCLKTPSNLHKKTQSGVPLPSVGGSPVKTKTATSMINNWTKPKQIIQSSNMSRLVMVRSALDKRHLKLKPSRGYLSSASEHAQQVHGGHGARRSGGGADAGQSRHQRLDLGGLWELSPGWCLCCVHDVRLFES